jgi:hypothetical protein
MSNLRFEYGFNSVNGIVKKKYYLHEIPFMHDRCDVWQILPLVYVRQFTGLLDKNGVEIYEGDKIKYKNYKGYSKIVFENGSFGYYGISCFITLLETNTDYIEVIGNVFQDSE